MTLARYVVRRFMLNILRVQLGVLFLILTLDGVEMLRIYSPQGATTTEAMQIALLRAPGFVMQTFSLVVLLAGMSTFLGLSRGSELVISRAAGQSVLRLLMVPVVVTLLLGLGVTAVFNPIVAATHRMAESMGDRYRPAETSLLSIGARSIWLRQGSETSQFVIQAEHANHNGTLLFNLRLHEFTLDGNPIRRIEAPVASLSDGAWHLTDAREWRFGAGREGLRTDVPERTAISLPTNLSSDDILDSFAPPQALSIWSLPAFIQRLEQSGFAAQRHKLFLQSELARPLLMVAMLLIGAGFSLRHARFGQTGVMVLIAVLAGFVLFAVKSLAESLGAAQEIPLLLAAWGPPVAAILLCLGLLLHLEDG